MADIMRRVVTLFDVRGSERVQASLATMEAGFGGVRRQMDMTNRTGGLVNSQLRALGTTLRYTFAGSAVFGTISMVRNLGEFQAKLGEISSIATGPGGLPVVGQELDRLGSQLIDVSNRTTQPISDLEEGVLSLYSTIGDVPPDEASGMMEKISEVAITSQSNIEDTTQALLGMLNAFDQGTDVLTQYGDEFFRVIQLSAGMPGRVYAQKLGVLSASASLGGFTPEQMGGLAIGATRGGGSAATNMQYLSQLMMFLMHPVSKEAQSTLAGIGLGPQQRQRMGGYQTLLTFLREVNRRGGVSMTGGLATASDDFLQQAEQQGLQAQDVGMQGGGSQLISAAFGRIQSQRMAAVLSRLVDPAQVAGTENQTLDDYVQQVADSAGAADEAMGRAMDYRRIQQAGNAMHNLGIEIGTAISPLLQLPAQGITGATSAFAHQSAWMQRGELAGGAVGAALLVRRLNGGAGTLMRGAGGAMAVTDALTGGSTRGDSPLNPLYVAVVYQLGGGRQQIPFSGIPNRDMRTAEEGIAGGAAGRAGGAARAGRFARSSGFLRRWGGPAAWLTAAGVASFMGGEDLAHAAGIGDPNSRITRENDRINNFFGSIFHRRRTSSATAGGRNLAGQETSLQRLDTLIAQAQRGHVSENRTAVHGEATVHIKDERTGKTHSVPLELFDKFSPSRRAPQTKGKPTTSRGGTS